mgnify:CR=1 FL=1
MMHVDDMAAMAASSRQGSKTSRVGRGRRAPSTILVIGFLVYLLALFHCKTALSLGSCCLIAGAFAIWSKVELRDMRGALMPLLFIAAITVVAQVASCQEGDVLFRIGGLSLYQDGFSNALITIARLVCLMAASVSLARCLDFRDAAKSMTRLLEPLRIRTDAFSLAFETALRFLPILLEEFRKDMKRRKSLAAESERGLRNTLSLLEESFSSLMVSSYARIDQVAQEYLVGENKEPPASKPSHPEA